MNHLNPSKKTILIEIDGANGLLLAHQLSQSNEFNIVCVSKQQNLNKTSSGAAPFYERTTRTYSEKLEFFKFGSPSRLSYLWNQHKTNEAQSESVLGQISELNSKIFESNFMKEVQPLKVEYELLASDGNSSKVSVRTFNKRYLLQYLVHALTFKKYPDLIVNSLEAMRPVYLDASKIASGKAEDNKKQYVGHFTNKGLILADYYILSTEENSLAAARALGLELPIAVSPNTVEDMKQPKNLIDEKNKVLALGEKALRAGRHGDKIISVETTPDRLPIVGKLSDSNNVYLNLGYGGNSMSLSLGTAQCIAAELTGKSEAPEFCRKLDYKRFYLVD